MKSNVLFAIVFAISAVILTIVCMKYTMQEVGKNEGASYILRFLKQSSINLSVLLITLFYFYAIIPPLIRKFSNTLSIDDVRWYYAAAKAAQVGLSPYEIEHFTTALRPLLQDSSEFTPFVYPPAIIPVIFPLSYFPYDTAAKLFLSVALLSVMFLLYGAMLLLDRKTASFKMYCVCAGALIYGVTWSVRLGNISVIVSALVVWVVFLASKDKDALAGILLGVSTLKPTLSLLFMVYFLLKKRFTLLGWSIATSFALTSLGLWICGTSVVDFVYLYRAGTELLLNDYWNSIYTSPVRIDAGVIGPRIFPDNVPLSNLVSNAIVVSFTAVIAWHLYRSQKHTHWSPHIDLGDVSLIACLSLLSMYSQPQNGSVLVLVVVLFLNYLSAGVLSKKWLSGEMVVWCLGALCLAIHSHLLYKRVSWYLLAHPDSVSYLAKISLGSLPNYAILGLTLCILILTRRLGSPAPQQSRQLDGGVPAFDVR